MEYFQSYNSHFYQYRSNEAMHQVQSAALFYYSVLNLKVN